MPSSITAKRRNSDTIDLITSSAPSAPFPVPSTSRNRRPRSATSSRSPRLLEDDSSVTGEEITDTPLRRDVEEGHSRTYPMSSMSIQLPRRKRRRVDVSDEDQEGEEHLSPHFSESNLTEVTPHASMSPYTTANPLLSSQDFSPDPTLGSPSSLYEELEHAESPPATQETIVSQAYSDAGVDISEVSVLTQRGTPLSVLEINDATSEDTVVASPILPQRGIPLVPTSDDVVVISPTLPGPLHRTPSLSHPLIIDDSTPLDMMPSSTPKLEASHSLPVAPVSSPSAPEPLSAYTCPICFSPPTNATLTPCGHICCGPCLFAAVKSMVKRNMVIAMDRAPVPRCPVCRAEIPGWDGRGGGVIGLKVQVAYSL